MGHLPAYDSVEAGARPGKDGRSQCHASVPRAQCTPSTLSVDGTFLEMLGP